MPVYAAPAVIDPTQDTASTKASKPEKKTPAKSKKKKAPKPVHQAKG
jgi:hypothetical protein